MPKLMEQSGCTGEAEGVGCRLLKVASQGYDRGLIGSTAGLASTAQGEVRCVSKLALSAHQQAHNCTEWSLRLGSYVPPVNANRQPKKEHLAISSPDIIQPCHGMRNVKKHAVLLPSCHPEAGMQLLLCKD